VAVHDGSVGDICFDGMGGRMCGCVRCLLVAAVDAVAPVSAIASTVSTVVGVGWGLLSYNNTGLI
jgi:hypothetical protein